jgi:hypothetical protein
MDIIAFIPTKLEEHATCQHRVHDALETEMILGRHQHSAMVNHICGSAQRKEISIFLLQNERVRCGISQNY